MHGQAQNLQVITGREALCPELVSPVKKHADLKVHFLSYFNNKTDYIKKVCDDSHNKILNLLWKQNFFQHMSFLAFHTNYVHYTLQPK